MSDSEWRGSPATACGTLGFEGLSDVERSETAKPRPEGESHPRNFNKNTYTFL